MNSNVKLSMKFATLVLAAVALFCICVSSSYVAGYIAQSNVEENQASAELPTTLAVISNPKQTINVLENLLRSIVFSNEIGR
jgi:hypothetical protein